MRSLCGIFLLMFLPACAGDPAPPPEMTNQERGAIQAQVLAWSDQFLDNLNHLDAHGVAILFDEADAHFANGAEYQASWEALSAGTQELYRGWGSWEGEWEFRRVDVLGPDAALLVGQANGTMTTAEGMAYDVRPVFSFVLRKSDDGRWSGLFGQVSSERTPR